MIEQLESCWIFTKLKAPVRYSQWLDSIPAISLKSEQVSLEYSEWSYKEPFNIDQGWLGWSKRFLHSHTASPVHFEDYIWKNWDFTHLYPYFWWKGLLHQLGNMKSIKYVEYNVFKPLPVLSEQTCSHTTKHDTRTIPTGCHVSSQAPGFRIRRKRTRPMMRWLQISVIARVSSFVDVLWLYSAEGF